MPSSSLIRRCAVESKERRAKNISEATSTTTIVIMDAPKPFRISNRFIWPSFEVAQAFHGFRTNAMPVGKEILLSSIVDVRLFLFLPTPPVLSTRRKRSPRGWYFRRFDVDDEWNRRLHGPFESRITAGPTFEIRYAFHECHSLSCPWARGLLYHQTSIVCLFLSQPIQVLPATRCKTSGMTETDRWPVSTW